MLKHSEELRQAAVRIALTSRLLRERVAEDLLPLHPMIVVACAWIGMFIDIGRQRSVGSTQR